METPIVFGMNFMRCFWTATGGGKREGLARGGETQTDERELVCIREGRK